MILEFHVERNHAWKAVRPERVDSIKCFTSLADVNTEEYETNMRERDARLIIIEA